MDEIIVIDELVRAGDVYLGHFKCPSCRNPQFEALPLKGDCKDCRINLEEHPADISKASKRLLAGSKRGSRHVSKKIVQTLLNIQARLCAYCSVDLGPFHVDHVLPLAGGGTNNLRNLALACPPCNLKAGAKCFSSIDAKRSWILKARGKNKKSPAG